MPRFTAQSIAAASRCRDTAELHDPTVPGLSVRVSAKGTATFTLRYRVGAIRRSAKLGHFGVLSIDQARAIAREKLAELASGIDPVVKRQRDQASLRVVDLLGSSGDEGWYLAEYVHTAGRLGQAKTPKGIYQDTRIIVTHLRSRRDLMRSKVAEVTVEDLLAIKRSVKVGVWPKVLNILRVCFGHAVEREAVTTNITARRILRAGPGRTMERFLSAEERAQLEAALQEWGSIPTHLGGVSEHVIRAIRICVLTGMRRGEVLSLRWDWIDWSRSVIRLPTSKTGQKEVPISSHALAYLRSEKGRAKGLVCATSKGTAILPDNLTRAWISIRATCGLDDVRLHDLRHSMASDLLSSGAPLAVVGKVLGHTQASTTQRYAHLADDALRIALERGAERIAAASRG